jgi:DNA-binding HxlR family transcriptional regulator
MAAFDAAVSPQLRTDDMLGVVKSRKWWAEILVSLASGSARPSELATSLKTDPAVISRGLSDLRALGLIEETEMADKGDARSRPHQLTLEGESIADRLDGAALVGKARLEPVIRTAISFFTQMAIEDRLSLPKTEPTVRRLVGPASGYVSSVLDKVLREYDLQHRSWAQEVFLTKLEDSATGKESSPGFRTAMQTIVGKGASTVYIRCARTQQPIWDQFIGRSKVFPSGSRTISPADIDAGDVPKPQGHNISLIYDCLPILQSDLDIQPEMRSLLDAANFRFCLGPHGTSLPGGFELLSMEA